MSAARAPARPRVLVVTPDFPPTIGGIQLLVSRLVDRLGDLDVRLVAPPAGEHPLLVGAVTRVPRGAWSAMPHRATVATLNGCAVADGLAHRPDVVLNMHVATAPAALALRRLRGVPFVQYAYAKEVPGRAGLARLAFGRAARVVAISAYGRDLVLAHGARPAAVRLIPPGVDRPASRPEPTGAGPRVVSVGRLHDEHKGHDTLIRAMALVAREVGDVRCRIVGDGALRPRLEALAVQVGAASHVDFLGRLRDEERDRELADATVFCMPSRVPETGAGEGFGIVYLEAGMHGVPSVAADAGGSVDAVIDGETGLLVEDPRDHVALAAALVRILRDPALRDRLGARARAQAEAATWERMAAAVSAVCREAAGATR